MVRRFGVLAVLVLSTHCVPTAASAVTYGDFVDSPQVQYPEVVPVWVGGSLCSGTLIEQQIVLTAAHCVYGRSGPIQIAVGGSTLSSGRLIDVTATWYHPRYDATYLQNDIALLHLKEPAGVARLATLPRPNAKKPKNFTMAGWGRDQNGLLTGKLSALTLNEHGTAAAKAFKGDYNPRTMIGAGRFFASEALYGGGCQGDSGGPLYQGRNGSTRVVVGVTSWGAEGCVQYKPTIYTWVGYYVVELSAAITQVKNRAIQNPLPSGKATPSGAGPTTTTTTLPPAPLTVRFLTETTLGGLQGIDGRFETNLQSPNRVAKICFVVNGQAFPEYDGGDLYFNYSKRTQSGGPGCYENITSTGIVQWSLYRIREYVSSTVYAVIHDNLGRSVITPLLRAQGTNPWRGLSTSHPSKQEFSSTTEINVQSSTGVSSIQVTKVCLTVTMNGAPFTSISSGRNGWTDIGGGCVQNTRGEDPYSTYVSSSILQNPPGLQDWIVHAHVYASDGSSKITSSYGYSS